MVSCNECNETFDIAELLRDHIQKMHKCLLCMLCRSGPFTPGGLVMHTRAKHSKSSWKVLYTCRTCNFFTATPERMREHYRTSSVHKCCDTCEEPYYDLPRPKSQRVMYHENFASLRLCEACGRRTLPRKVAVSDEAGSDGALEEAIELGTGDDLETTVGGYY
ncbi:hypothetical protein PHLGIDRAFT_10439 [Phlebiopsis gigantea 11061_1 CR5-6]|uniref:C2H2-type domain-containing protein n=1 Tax=Phlebiopsis gigantea (strain 11061_1 CR5-6) TaxID=745531 RepID=A0A0C3SFE1_PHLG1|nr:hypothetical protein PHLGIDRAFT_10439 [Phlebiopsis gigantea 11061_1 CR5-6]